MFYSYNFLGLFLLKIFWEGGYSNLKHCIWNLLTKHKYYSRQICFENVNNYTEQYFALMMLTMEISGKIEDVWRYDINRIIVISWKCIELQNKTTYIYHAIMRWTHKQNYKLLYLRLYVLRVWWLYIYIYTENEYKTVFVIVRYKFW